MYVSLYYKAKASITIYDILLDQSEEIHQFSRRSLVPVGEQSIWRRQIGIIVTVELYCAQNEHKKRMR